MTKTNRKTTATTQGAEPRDQSPVETTPTPPAPAASTHPKGKLGLLAALLRRPGGASLEAMTAATGWQAHSVRGAMSGALKKKLKLAITSEKTDAGRVWRIVEPAA